MHTNSPMNHFFGKAQIMNVHIHNDSSRRRGSVLVLTTLLLVVMLTFLAFAIDIGYLQLARVELQQSADAAALAACAELVDDEAITGHADLTDEVSSARTYAVTYAGLNKVCQQAPAVNSNAANSSSGDVVVGNLNNPSDPNEAMSFTNPAGYNAVKVHVKRTSSQNGEVPLFFARVMGIASESLEASGTAALINN